ncbi:MAG: BT4734/BF3469 family protein, partial [Syntrophales bacterium]
MIASFFTSCTQTSPTGNVTIQDIVEMTCRPGAGVIQTVDTVRRLVTSGNKAVADEEKKKLPCVTLSGIFSKRNKESLTRHSGLVTLDFDQLDDVAMAVAREKLINDPYVVTVFTSPSGRGLKGAVKVEPAPSSDEGHLTAWQGARCYFKETHGLELDPSGKDVSRLCFQSHDPDCHYNETAQSLPVAEWQPEQPVVVQPIDDQAERDGQ